MATATTQANPTTESSTAAVPFLCLAPETRVRIYRQVFEKAVVRFTKPRKGKARVYAKTRVSLILICKAIYLEAQPFLAASVTLVLKNARISPTTVAKPPPPFKFLRHLEVVYDVVTTLDVSCFPALKTLKLSAPGKKRGWLRFDDPRSEEEAEAALLGDQDEHLKRFAHRVIMSGAICFEGKTPFPQPHTKWLSMLISAPHRKYRIIDTVPIIFPPPNPSFRTPAFRFSNRGIHLDLEYDVDTLETVRRSLYERQKHHVQIWEDGKLQTYRMRKDGRPGKLLESEDVEYLEVDDLAQSAAEWS